MSRFLNVHFLLKLLAFILNLIALIIYHVMEVEQIFEHFNYDFDYYHDPTYQDLLMSRRILYAHTIPPYLIIMFVLFALYIVNRPPGKLMCKVFLLVGAILSFALAVLIFILYSKHHSKIHDFLYKHSHSRPNYFTGSLIVGIISIINCLIYIVDFVLYFMKNFD